MRPLDGDPELLARAGRRSLALVTELDRLRGALRRATEVTASRWSGAGAAAFATAAGRHGALVTDAAAVIERIGVLTSGFAHELGDAQLRARSLPPDATTERRMVEEAMALSRTRFQRQLMALQSEATRLLLGGPSGPPRWTGPVRPPVGRRNRRGPIQPPRWTGPVRPPRDWTPPHGSIKLLPAPADRTGGAARLPWTPPWRTPAGIQPPPTRVHPIGGRA